MPAVKAVSVAVRCRIILPHDKDQRICVGTKGERDIEVLDPEHLFTELREKHGRVDYLKENHCKERAYTFDSVFGPVATTEEVYEKLVAPLVPEVLAGKNATCFAYGQTGSGKTHTMLGRQGEAGVVERTLQRLIPEATAAGSTIGVTFIEVYNEKIRDLLSPKCPVLDLRDDPVRGACIAGVTEVPATSAAEVMNLVREGNGRRTEEKTAANPVSSRSHAVLQIMVETDLPGGAGRGGRGAKVGRRRCAKLALIDLAGSERAANTGNRGARLREGAAINRSLLALANCITALTRKGAYVNYRDSKLTRLLKDSLSGNCFTTMIAHVSPSILSFEETLNTLKYAHRACEIRGMVGGVRENISEVGPKYAGRLQPCLEATSGLKRAVAKLAVVVDKPAAGAGVRPSLQGSSPPASRAMRLADALDSTRVKVVQKIRTQMQIEQTAQELDDQNEANNVELSKLELNSVLEQEMCGGGVLPPMAPFQAHGGAGKPLPDVYSELVTTTRKNEMQKHKIEQRCARVEGRTGDDSEQKLVSLLGDAKRAIEGDSASGKDLSDVEKRLLQAQHAMALLEIEKVEAEQNVALLQAAARKHELALQKQQLQFDVHVRACEIAEALFQKHNLMDEWTEALGSLGKILPTHVVPPSLDELIHQVSAPTTPCDSRRASPTAMGAHGPGPDGDRLSGIEEGYNEMRQTLNRSMKMTFTYTDDGDFQPESEDEDLADIAEAAGTCEDEDEEEAEEAAAVATNDDGGEPPPAAAEAAGGNRANAAGSRSSSHRSLTASAGAGARAPERSSDDTGDN